MIFEYNTPSDQQETLEIQCFSAAKDLLDRYQWSLLGPDQLANRAAELVRSSETELPVNHACLQSYAAEMYRYISEEKGSKRELAFTELWTYLLAVAARRGKRDRAEEFAQRTIEKVWLKNDQCRSALSFLAWATVILGNEIVQDYRYQTRNVVIGEEKSADKYQRSFWTESQDDIEKDKNEGELSIENGLVKKQASSRLMNELGEILPSQDQVEVIKGLYLEERKPLELAKELELSVQYIYVLKGRALNRLNRSKTIISTLSDIVQFFPVKGND